MAGKHKERRGFTLVELLVAEGESVSEGQTVAILDE